GGKLELRRVFAHEKPQELDECPTSGAHFIGWLCLTHRGACIAGKPAPTEKQSTAVLTAKLGQNCGSEQARSHSWISVHQTESVLLCFCPAFASTTQVGY
nr:hypothetical protein [Pseudomonas sp. AU10]